MGGVVLSFSGLRHANLMKFPLGMHDEVRQFYCDSCAGVACPFTLVRKRPAAPGSAFWVREGSVNLVAAQASLDPQRMQKLALSGSLLFLPILVHHAMALSNLK